MSSKQNKVGEFEPKIVAFLCNWCAYAGADLAGTSRFYYPPNVRSIRIMCSGAVDPVYVLKALLNGADGVLIAGCHLGNCHYKDGNYKAKHRLETLKNILAQVGIDKDRIWLRWIDASEGALFRDTVWQMVADIKIKGPNPLRNSWKVWQKTYGAWKPKTIGMPTEEQN
jgi:F420-non-reducing hydrogenase iron-sulfur subunit